MRLFGRNLRRVQTRILTEAPLDLGGLLNDLYYVEPAEIEPIRRGRSAALTTLSDWAQDFITKPYVGGTPDLFKAQVRLAHEAVRLYGNRDATEFLSAKFREIEERSPALSDSSRRNLWRRDTVTTVIDYASRRANEHHNTLDMIWCPKSDIGTRKPAVRVYRALSEYVIDNGLDPFCFGMTFDRIADLAGYAGKGKARDALLLAVDASLIVRLDPGVPKNDGGQGLCGLYALVGEGQDPAQVCRVGASTTMYGDRNKERLRRGLQPLPSYTEELDELLAAA